MEQLNNIRRKLKQEKKATIAYLGGSVTGGFGSTNAAEYSWRALSGKHFTECFPNAEINLVNAAVGGTGTGYARFRLKKDVLDHNPDLIFIEFSINDCYEGYKVEQSKLYYESLIHTIHNFNPEIDIVMVVITDRGNMKNGPSEIAKLHYELAEYYNIPVIDVLAAVASDMKENPDHNEDYFLKDWAHPNDCGYAFYASVVNKFIDENIVEGDFGEIAEHTINPAQSADIIVGETESHAVNEFSYTAINGFALTGSNQSGYMLKSEKAGDSIEFDFEGTHFSAWVQLGGVDRVEGGADSVECYVDGELKATFTVKSWSSATVHRHIVHALENKQHHIVLKNANGGLLIIKRIFLAK